MNTNKHKNSVLTTQLFKDSKDDQFDVFEYLDEPMASKETIEKLREFWERYKAETEQWCR